MTIPVRYIQYGFGQHRIFYVTEGGGDILPPPDVHCYFPDNNIKADKLIIALKHLDEGIYYFDIFFKLLGNHLFVFYELLGEPPELRKTGLLNAIIKDRMT